MSNTAASPPERPLTGPAKLGLMASAAATIALFYLFFTATILALLVWISGELVVFLGLARFGAGGLVLKFVERDIRLLFLLAAGLWRRRGPDYRLELKPEEAPGIMAILTRLCRRLGIPAPDALYLEMNCGAWVELRGLRQNLGRTHIGLGYDLLAGLNEAEVEAVLAHELAHAKLIHRAFKNWVGAGFGRAATMANQLSAVADAHRRAGRKFTVAEKILAVADRLARRCARLVAAYSRQDEFEADHGAAILCGSASLRSALRRLEAIYPVLARLPWNERVAQIESDEGLSRWLVREIATGTAAPPPPHAPEVFDRYSTHPSNGDRIAALPADQSDLPAGAPGLSLLAAPDAVALKLVREIERHLLAEEQKDLKELRRWLRQARRGATLRLAHLPSVALGFVALLGALGAVAAESYWAGLLIAGGGFATAYLAFRLVRFRDPAALPLPEFTRLIDHWPEDRSDDDLKAAQKLIEREMVEIASRETKQRRQAALLASTAFAALAERHYLRAHVAARLALDRDKRSVGGALALAIASAAFGQVAQAEANLAVVQKASGLKSAGTVWGAAWTMILLGAWMPAEALLLASLKPQPGNPTLVALLAACQARRGKLQSAIANLRRICQPAPPSPGHTRLLIRLLLDRGALREAAYWLTQLDARAADDREVEFSQARLHLLRRDFAGAEKWIAKLELLDLSGHRLVAIGDLFVQARDDARATEFHRRALTRGHYPEALLALARQAAQCGDKAQARRHALAALDFSKPPGEKALLPAQLFQPALNQLLWLADPVADCRAWIAGILAGKDSGPLKQRNLMVYARDEREAAAYLGELLQAMEPNKEVPPAAYYKIDLAPHDLQPVQPVRPGVQHIYN